jgi:hypothetical protein
MKNEQWERKGKKKKDKIFSKTTKQNAGFHPI